MQLKWNVPEEPGGEMELTYVLQISPAPAGEDGSGMLIMVSCSDNGSAPSSLARRAVLLQPFLLA